MEFGRRRGRTSTGDGRVLPCICNYRVWVWGQLTTASTGEGETTDAVSTTGSTGSTSTRGMASSTGGSTETSSASVPDLGTMPDQGSPLPGGCEGEKIDFVFVISDSNTMEFAQKNLLAAFPGFMAAIEAMNIDKHILVTHHCR